MSYHHIRTLIQRRARIQREIDAERARAHPQWARLATLKKIRLRLKDHLAHLHDEATRVVEGPRQAMAAEERRRRHAISH